MFVHAQFRPVSSSTSPLLLIWISLRLSTLNFCHFIKKQVSIAQLRALTGCFHSFKYFLLSTFVTSQFTPKLYRTEIPLHWESRTCTPWQLNTFRNLGWATWLRFTVKLDYHALTYTLIDSASQTWMASFPSAKPVPALPHHSTRIRSVLYQLYSLLQFRLASLKLSRFLHPLHP